MASAKDGYLDWKRKTPDMGCVFARLIANTPERYGQRVETVGAASTPTRVAGSICSRIDRMLDDPGTSAGTLLFPGLTDLEGLAKALLALHGRPGWTVGTTPLIHPEAGDLVAVSLVRSIPFGETTIPSEALVLGPFAEFAPTRRAPVVALELFVGRPLGADPKTGQPTAKANLAHIEIPAPTPAFYARMWERSQAGRLKSLGGVDDVRAKAKVAFVMPLDMAKKLGAA